MSSIILWLEYYQQQLEVVTKGIHMVHEELKKLMSLTSDVPQAQAHQRQSGLSR